MQTKTVHSDFYQEVQLGLKNDIFKPNRKTEYLKDDSLKTP